MTTQSVGPVQFGGSKINGLFSKKRSEILDCVSFTSSGTMKPTDFGYYVLQWFSFFVNVLIIPFTLHPVVSIAIFLLELIKILQAVALVINKWMKIKLKKIIKKY